MIQFFWDVVWVLGDILQFVCKVGIMFCLVMFVLHLGGVFKPKSNTHEAVSTKQLPTTSRKALTRNPKSLPRSK